MPSAFLLAKPAGDRAQHESGPLAVHARTRPAAARCRWLLTLEDPDALPATASASMTAVPEPPSIVAALRRLLTDDSILGGALMAGGAVGSHCFELVGTWESYLRACERNLNGREFILCGFSVVRVEPVFTPEYLARIRQREMSALDNFIGVYGPVFEHAVTRERARLGRRSDLPSVDELLTDTWERFMRRIDGVLQKFKASEGGQAAYLYQEARFRALDSLRKVLGLKETPVDLQSECAQQPQAPDLARLLENRDLLEKILHAFQKECAQRPQRALPNDWDLVRLHFLEGVSKDELRARYDMTSNVFDARVARVRKRLWQILQSLRAEL